MLELKKLSPSLADAEELSAISKRAYCDHYLHLWHDGGEWYLERCFTPAVLLKEMADTNALFYLLSADNEKIGFIKLNIDAALENCPAERAMELERIYFIKSAAGRGFGRLAMDFAIGLAKDFKKETIWLKAMDSSLGAIAFYQKMGFEICGQTRLGFAAMREEFRGMVVMKRGV